jgi:hypothetical protein
MAEKVVVGALFAYDAANKGWFMVVVGLADVLVWSLLVVVLVVLVVSSVLAVVVDVERCGNRHPKPSLSEFESRILTK